MYYGVCWHKETAKWRAQIQINGRRTHLGYFTCEKEAARAFNKSAIENYGEFARLNELSDSESDSEIESETRTVSNSLDEFAGQMSSYLI